MLATEYAKYHRIDPQGKGETNSEFKHRVAGRLRDMGKVILAHEAQRNERIEDSRDVMVGVQGAIAQAIQGVNYNVSGEMQVGVDICAGEIAMDNKSRPSVESLLLAIMMGE